MIDPQTVGIERSRIGKGRVKLRNARSEIIGAVGQRESIEVRLHWCKVREWAGDFEMREGQAMCWQQLPLEVSPVLPGAMPVLDWLAQERGLGAA